MCLAIPAKIIKIKNNLGIIDVEGVTRETNLILIEDARVGDYVIIHAGFAIRKIDEFEALESLQILRHGAVAEFDG